METQTETMVYKSKKSKHQGMKYSPDPFKEAKPVTLEKNLPSLPATDLLAEVQVTPGELEGPSPYETIDEKMIAVKIGEIHHFTDVPDFVAPSRSKHPFVVHTSEGFFCLDGMHLVEQAKAEKKKSVTCYVEYMPTHSDKELAIRKVANRVVPRGGRTSYAEGVRNTKHLEDMLLSTQNEDLKSFIHGGERRGKEFANNKQENVRAILSDRLELSRPTIDQILAHARYLNNETLNFLVTEKASKDFFEEAQKNRTAKTRNMESQKAGESTITIEISKSMREWYQEFKTTTKITPVWKTAAPAIESPPQDTAPTVEASPETTALPEISEVKELQFKPWQGTTNEESEDSFERVKIDVEAIAKRLHDTSSIDDLEEFEKQVMQETQDLFQITQRIAALKNTIG